jgi:hypothetical protein
MVPVLLVQPASNGVYKRAVRLYVDLLKGACAMQREQGTIDELLPFSWEPLFSQHWAFLCWFWRLGVAHSQE